MKLLKLKLSEINRFSAVSVFAAFVCLLSSCSNFLFEKASDKTGTLCVNQGTGRALYIDEITGAEVTLSCFGEADRTVSAAVSGGVGSAVFTDVPAGRNLVVSVAAKKNINSALEKIDGVVMRAAADVVSGQSSSVSVTWASTALGNTFYELIKNQNYDVSSLYAETVESYLPENVHPLLINTAALAADIKNSSVKSADSYKIAAGTVSFSVNTAKTGAVVQVCDPASSKIEGLTGSEQTVENVVPGTWSFYIIVDGTIVYSNTVTVISGQNTDLGDIVLKLPAPRLEDSSGHSITDLSFTSEKTVYLACRTYDGEAAVDGAVIYYTTDGSEPTMESGSVYNEQTGITVSGNSDFVIKAFGVKSGLENSDVVSYNLVYRQTGLGYSHPVSGAYSPVSEGLWTSAAWGSGALPASKNGNTTFAVYSKNAEKVLLEIYSSAAGEDALYDYWMTKGSDNFWRAEIASVPDGALYGFRCWGPNWTYSSSWQRGGSSAGFVQDADSSGNRFNPNKVLYDPYARELSHDTNNESVLNGESSSIFTSGSSNRNIDTGRYAPKGVVVYNEMSGYGTKPELPAQDAIIYEAHVRGLTKHSSTASLASLLSGISGFEDVQNIPEEYRGTYKGVIYMIPYLKALGITTIELLPVQETENDGNPDNQPGGNFWGYMTFGYFAPDRRYSSDKTLGGPTKEFKEMVKSLHDAGMEVYLDVVYNHTGEGGTWQGSSDNYAQATLVSFRGFDNSEYYSLVKSGGTLTGAYWETSGCGNNMQCDNSMVRKFIMDSLEYWLDYMGVDGFRFDLATVLGRVNDGSNNWVYSSSAQTLTAIQSLGDSKNVEMIAESWDCGSDSYQVGNFPNGWGGWNGRYRDVARGYIAGVKGNGDGSISVGDALYGDYGNFNDQGGPHKSVNFIVAHDGFTLADVTSYSTKSNKSAWPFGTSDGGDDSTLQLGDTTKSWRRQTHRNLFSFLMFSRGVPMIVYGDEFCRTQNGNNNPYNIDSVCTWNNYSMIKTAEPHAVSTGSGTGEGGTYHNNFGTFGNENNTNGNFMFVKYLMNLRKNEPALRQTSYADVEYSLKKENGTDTLTTTDRCIWLKISGSSVPEGNDYLVFLNMHTAEVSFTVPSAASGRKWIRIIDTQEYFESNYNYWEDADAVTISESYGVQPWSIVVLKQI